MAPDIAETSIEAHTASQMIAENPGVTTAGDSSSANGRGTSVTADATASTCATTQLRESSLVSCDVTMIAMTGNVSVK